MPGKGQQPERKLGLSIFACLGLLWCLLPALGKAAGQEKKPTPVLVLADCRKCHPAIPQEMARAGGAHNSAVNCLDCHPGHPPREFNIIPRCGKCHKPRNKHFALENCLGCHANPHTPLTLKLSRNLKGACLTCHPDPGQQMQASPSYHSVLACTACHNEHGQVPACHRCHLPHVEGQINETCTACHQAHKPLEVRYGTDMPSENCGACHPEPYEKLARSPARHRKLPCVRCHSDRHGNIPRCAACHGQPHPKAMLAVFPECGECHGIAHDINTASKHARRPRNGR